MRQQPIVSKKRKYFLQHSRFIFFKSYKFKIFVFERKKIVVGLAVTEVSKKINPLFNSPLLRYGNIVKFCKYDRKNSQVLWCGAYFSRFHFHCPLSKSSFHCATLQADFAKMRENALSGKQSVSSGNKALTRQGFG